MPLSHEDEIDAIRSICRVLNGANGEQICNILASAYYTAVCDMAPTGNVADVACYHAVGMAQLIEKLARIATGNDVYAESHPAQKGNRS